MIKKFLPHVIGVGKQGTGKDVLLVSDIKKMITEGKSIFEHFYSMDGYYYYENRPKRVYSNMSLKMDYIPLKTVKDVETASDGILYISDLDLWFNSRGFLTKKDNPELLRLVNDMRKRGLQLRGSCHRVNSIDVKLRTLIHFWFEPKMVLIGKDPSKRSSYGVSYTFYDAYRSELGNGFLDSESYKENTEFYDTDEEVKELEKTL